MDIWKHSLLSAHKFGGIPENYYDVHEFIDSSKLFYFNVKHRLLLHHTFGIELCIRLFGDFMINGDNKTILIRDIAAEHLKEDLYGKVPTLNDWLEKNTDINDQLESVQLIQDQSIKEFVLQPYLKSGIKSSLLITFSDFGVSLVEKTLGFEKALILRKMIPEEQNVKTCLKKFKFHSRWQYSPNMEELKAIEPKQSRI